MFTSPPCVARVSDHWVPTVGGGLRLVTVTRVHVRRCKVVRRVIHVLHQWFAIARERAYELNVLCQVSVLAPWVETLHHWVVRCLCGSEDADL